MQHGLTSELSVLKHNTSLSVLSSIHVGAVTCGVDCSLAGSLSWNKGGNRGQYIRGTGQHEGQQKQQGLMPIHSLSELFS